MLQSSVGTAASNDMIEDSVHVSDEGDAGAEWNDVADGTSPIPSSDPSGGGSSKGEKKSRKRKSEVWEFCKMCECTEGEEEVNRSVECKFCETKYKCVQSGTTSTMQRHVKGWGKYCQFKSRELLAKMITAHELPFMFVEYQWFNTFMKYNNPMYQKVSRNTIKKECVKVFETEKDKLKKVFENIDRISLTCDCWTSNQTVGYMCLTAYYIDPEWNLQKRIISFGDLSPPRSGEVIHDAIMEALRKWGIENKIGTITFDDAPNNDRAAALLKFTFEYRGKLHFQGLFFHIRCCANILNLVVQDGLSQIESCLVKIREGIKYLKKSMDGLLKFKQIAVQLGITTKRTLCIDVKTRWNSTYFMLESALLYKKAFKQYASRDSNFEWLPSESEWDNAEKVCKLLDVFGDVTSLFSADDRFTHEIAMYEKFEKYWGEVNLLMAVASVLDPRLKMISIKFVFGRLYPSNEVEARVAEVMEKLRALYDMYSKEYAASSESGAGMVSGAGASTSSGAGAGSSPRNDFWRYLQSTWNDDHCNSELDDYLKESVFQHRDTGPFDVLKWWKTNVIRFPILSKLARDILCIPLTTVASESAFSAGGHVLDDYHSSLSKEMVEMLVCSGDWIRSNTVAELQTLQQAVKVEENLEIEFPINQLKIN